MIRGRGVAVPLLLLGLGASAAHAGQSDTPTPDFSPRTLHDGEWRLGLLRSEYGVGETFQLGTILPFWLVGVANLNAEWRFWESGPWSASAALGLFTLDASRLDEDLEGVRVSAFPFALIVGRELSPEWRLDLTLGYSALQVSGDESVEIEGVAAVSTAFLALATEWRLGPVLALVLDAQILLRQDLEGGATNTLEIDDRTTVELFGDADADLTTAGVQGHVILNAVWSWDTFNLRVGLGYGDIPIPIVNLTVPVQSVFPALDLYWRF